MSPTSSSPSTPQSVFLRDENEFSPNLDRPLGRKSSKKQAKDKNSLINDSEGSITTEQWQQRIELAHAKAERQERALAQHAEQLAQHAEQLAQQAIQLINDQKRNELEEKRLALQIMQTDTTNMDPATAEYWENLKLETMRKRTFNV